MYAVMDESSVIKYKLFLFLQFVCLTDLIINDFTLVTKGRMATD